MEYKINWSNGNTTTCETLDKAYEMIYRCYPEAIIGHENDLMDGGNQTYAWEYGDEVNNDGARAIAVIKEVK